MKLPFEKGDLVKVYKKHTLSLDDYNKYEIGIFLGEKEYPVGMRNKIFLNIAYCPKNNRFQNDLFSRFEKMEEK